MIYTQENTICSISTKKGEGAIAIIRISATKQLIYVIKYLKVKKLKT